MSNFIDYNQVKEALNWPIVLSHYGVKYVEGRNQQNVKSPFYEDKSPSFSISFEKKVFQCFGSKAQGNILDFVCDMEEKDRKGQGLREAAELAIERILERRVEDFWQNNGRKQKKADPKKLNKKAKPAPKSESKNLPTENKPLNFTLQNLNQEHAWFSERRVSKKAVETFGLGFFEGKGMMTGRIVFPIHNAQSELVAYCGRWVDGKPPEGEGKYKMPPSFNKSLELYNQHRAKAMLDELGDDAPPLIVVEGFWSAIRLHEAGYPVVAVFGSSISEHQAKVIADLAPDALIIFDGDEAGRAGALRDVGLLAQHIFVRTLFLDEGEKPDIIDLKRIEEAL